MASPRAVRLYAVTNVTALVIVFGALVGGAVGSFAGVVAARGLHASLGGRSHCDGCGRTLDWFELIPLLSFIALRGRCRTCGARIGWPTYLWELGGAAVGVVIALTILLLAGRAGG